MIGYLKVFDVRVSPMYVVEDALGLFAATGRMAAVAVSRPSINQEDDMVTTNEIEELQRNHKRLRGAVKLLDGGIEAAAHGCDVKAVKEVLSRGIEEARESVAELVVCVEAMPRQQSLDATMEVSFDGPPPTVPIRRRKEAEGAL